MSSTTPATPESLFVMNEHSHYFHIDTAAVAINKDLFEGCTFFDNEDDLYKAVCDTTGLDLDEVEGYTFLITKESGEIIWVDDRGFWRNIEEPVDQFVSSFEL